MGTSKNDDCIKDDNEISAIQCRGNNNNVDDAIEYNVNHYNTDDSDNDDHNNYSFDDKNTDIMILIMKLEYQLRH